MINILTRMIEALKTPAEKIRMRVKLLLRRKDVLIPGIDTEESQVVITVRQAVAELREAEEAFHEVDPHHQEAAFLRLACTREQLNNLFVEAKAEGVTAKFVYTCKGRENGRNYLYC
ncbi:hypothetical protein ACP3TJ_02290 [Desulforudis sp. 1088]|uniref:hypothetical protein n=1 Tax=unclassified Candidatus Desulforudis TaxID=2635950 RepID=UPI003474C821